MEAVQRKKLESAAIVGCMDSRLTERIQKAKARLREEYGPGIDIHVYRNAGARVISEIFEQAEHTDMKVLVLMPHKDCKAVGYAREVILGEIHPSPAIKKIFVEPLKAAGSNSRSSLEQFNADLQREVAIAGLENLKRDVEVDLSLVDLNGKSVPKNARRSIYIVPSQCDYREVMGDDKKGAFVLQSDKFDDIIPDLQVAAELLSPMLPIVIVTDGKAAGHKTREFEKTIRQKLKTVPENELEIEVRSVNSMK